MNPSGSFVILEATPHRVSNGRLYAYGPYVREINLWLRLLGRPAIVVAPVENSPPRPIDLPYESGNVQIRQVPRFGIVNWQQALRALFVLPLVTVRIFGVMKKAGHIHLRCPSNIGLVGLLVQIFFPGTAKTVKYAGNWHAYPGEPWSYRFQKFLARSPVWCRRTRVLAYGPNAAEEPQVISSFAPSYCEADARNPLSIRIPSREGEVRLLFVGNLASNKRPLVAVQVCHQLRLKGVAAKLDVLGDGSERDKVEEYARKHELERVVVCHGHVAPEVVAEHLRRAHFLLLLSESEGWPKVVSEAMFWGTLPVATPVGCVPMMLDEGRRGAIVEPRAESVCAVILEYLTGRRDYRTEAERAAAWARQYTLEAFAVSLGRVLASLGDENERPSDR